MSGTQLTAAILVVSTTAFKDPSTDLAGTALQGIFAEFGGGQWMVVETRIVPDDVLQIQRQVLLWADNAAPVNLIITTGGTGFAVADNTPEAVAAPAPQAGAGARARDASSVPRHHAV